MIRKFITELYNESSSLQFSDMEYKALEKDLNHFNLGPQIYSLLKQNSHFDMIPTNLRDHLTKQYQSQFIQSLLIKNQTHTILSKFEEKGVYVIPLKGPLFSEKYFNDFAARSSSDIDILVKESQVDEAIACIRSLGFDTEEKNDEGHFHRTFSKPIPRSSIPLLIEIHWNLLKGNTSNLSMEELWNNATPNKNNQFVKELSTLYTFYFIIIHAWRHNLDSMKHFLDIIQMIHKLGNELDYPILLRIARKNRTLKRVKRTLSIVYQQFPHLNHIVELPFREEYGSMWQYEVIRGNKVDKLKVYFDFIEYQFKSFDTSFHCCIALIEWLFPSKFRLEVELKHNQLSYLPLFKQRSRRLLLSLFMKEKL